MGIENFGGNANFETPGIKTSEEGNYFNNEKRRKIEEEIANMYRSMEAEALRRVMDQWKFRCLSERIN